ncbi:MAG: universal stress protein [Phycisphaerales bacterium]
MYSTILVALENSPTDDAILRHIRPLAKVHGASLVLVHVADGFAARYQEGLNLEDSEEIRKDRAYLARCQRELESDGFRVATALEKGDPATGLIAAAVRERCDLIAMATHGHGPVSDLLRGSVADKVRHSTDIPVLMLRARRPAG